MNSIKENERCFSLERVNNKFDVVVLIACGGKDCHSKIEKALPRLIGDLEAQISGKSLIFIFYNKPSLVSNARSVFEDLNRQSKDRITIEASPVEARGFGETLLQAIKGIAKHPAVDSETIVIFDDDEHSLSDFSSFYHSARSSNSVVLKARTLASRFANKPPTRSLLSVGNIVLNRLIRLPLDVHLGASKLGLLKKLIEEGRRPETFGWLTEIELTLAARVLGISLVPQKTEIIKEYEAKGAASNIRAASQAFADYLKIIKREIRD